MLCFVLTYVMYIYNCYWKIIKVFCLENLSTVVETVKGLYSI
jgi:hypothetical protein